MSIEKIAVRISTLQSVGNSLDDGLEAARKELNKVEGIVPAMDQLSTVVETLCKAVENDIDQGVVPTKEVLEIAAYAKKYILQAKKLVDDASNRAKNARLINQGSVMAMEQSVKNIKKMYDSEITKIESLKRALEYDDPSPRERVPGQHPGRPLKERRLAEEMKEKESEKIEKESEKIEKESEKIETSSEQAPEAPKSPSKSDKLKVQQATKKPATKRRRRKKAKDAKDAR